MAKLNGKNFTVVAQCKTEPEVSESGMKVQVHFALRSDGWILRKIAIDGSGGYSQWLRLKPTVEFNEEKLRGVVERRGFLGRLKP